MGSLHGTLPESVGSAVAVFWAVVLSVSWSLLLVLRTVLADMVPADVCRTASTKVGVPLLTVRSKLNHSSATTARTLAGARSWAMVFADVPVAIFAVWIEK